MLRCFLNLLFHFFYVRFGKSFGNDVFLKIVCDYKSVAVPYYLADKRVYEEFARFYVVGVFKHFGQKIFLHFLDGQMVITFLRFLVDFYFQSVQFVL